MIQAVIGIEQVGPHTRYFKRSPAMKNYPGVWSLLSIQYTDDELRDQLDLMQVRPLFRRMADDRMMDCDIKVRNYVTSGTCSKNPMNTRVILHLYRVELGPFRINPDYYTDTRLMLPEEFQALSKDQTCGFCVGLWSRHLVATGQIKEPFAPYCQDPESL